jgi:SAM-dependent methyltransferase
VIRLSIAGSLRDRPARPSKTCPAIDPDFDAIGSALRRGQPVIDRVFDQVFPAKVREVSSVYWTPVDVAMRAARLLTVNASSRILDIGSGVGKFCIIAAAAGAHVRGIEHREHFVDIARDAAAKLGVQPQFHLGTLDEQDPASIDGIYLFNPFAENLSPPEDHLDETVELSDARFCRDIETAERFLNAARLGTRVVTYCGFGGAMPATYRLVRRERSSGNLELWVKSRSIAPHVQRTAALADVVSLSSWRARQTALRIATGNEEPKP